MNYLGEDEITQVMGIGYPGEVSQGPDGRLYEWVQGVDGLGIPRGFWRRRIHPALQQLRRRRRKARLRLLAAQKRRMANMTPIAPPAMPAVPAASPQQVGGMGALYQAPDGSFYEMAGLSEDDVLDGLDQNDDLLDGLGQDDLVQMMGLGQTGEIRRGPDGSLYQWVDGVDGLGNAFGFWKKIKSFARKVTSPVRKVVKKVAQLATKPWCIPLQAVPGPVRSVARRFCRLIGPLKPLSNVPVVGSYYRGVARLCNIAKGCGIAGYEGPLMQAPDGTVYTVDGLGQDDELYGLGNLYQAPDGSLYTMAGFAEQDDLEGYLGQDDELTGYGQDEDLMGYGEDEDLMGYGEDEDLMGYGEDEDLMGYGEDEDLMGYGEQDDLNEMNGYLTQDQIQGLDAFVKDGTPDSRKFQAGTPDTWRSLW